MNVNYYSPTDKENLEILPNTSSFEKPQSNLPKNPPKSYCTPNPAVKLSIADCLKREFKEETNLDVTIGNHIYTTDFFQISAFNNKDQILSIYYYVHTDEPIELTTHTIPFHFSPHQVADANGESEVFRWIEWNDLNESTVSLPIDKVVVKMLKKV